MAPGVPIYVGGDLLVTPLGGGTLPFRFQPSADPSPCVHGVSKSDYYDNLDINHGRDSIFYGTAAARPGLYRLCNAASTASAAEA
jgi:hypothetical protein